MPLPTFTGVDLDAVLRLFAEAAPTLGVTEAAFTRRVLLDPAFNPHLAFILRDESNTAAGFLLAIRNPAISVTSGWITLFAVREDLRGTGIGTSLFNAAEAALVASGATSIKISPYAPGYWTPGIDEAAYPKALAFLERRGYTPASRAIGMNRDLTDLPILPWVEQRKSALTQHGVAFEPAQAQHIQPLLEMLSEEFGTDWVRYAGRALEAISLGFREPADVLIAHQAGRVLGFAHIEAERFGPFGVRQTERGRGIGAVLLDASLRSMRQRGKNTAWFMWTGEEAARRVYEPAGFVRNVTYRLFEKGLAP